MSSPRWSPVLFTVALLGMGFVSACRTTWVVVPRPEGGYSAVDTLYGRLDGERDVRVTFYFDTTFRVDTVRQIDTTYAVRVDTILLQDQPEPLRPAGTPVGVPPLDPEFQPAPGTRVDTVSVVVSSVDTVRVPIVETVTRVDTVRLAVVDTVVRTETVVRVDTVRVATSGAPRVDTVRVTNVDTVRVATQGPLRLDTVRIVNTDTVRVIETIVRVDTVTVTETVRSPGRRVLFVPPGQYPPTGQCRIWIYDLPPGQQARATACDALGAVPAGAFILFGGEAWDFDYDWIAEGSANPGSVPTEVIAVQRRGRGGG